jgi:hypothetical protein
LFGYWLPHTPLQIRRRLVALLFAAVFFSALLFLFAR